MGFVKGGSVLYAARVADKRDQYEGRELIRARVAVWRAEVWTSWLPAMMVLPVVMVVWPGVLGIIKAILRGENESLSYLLPEFVENAAIWGGGLVALLLVRHALIRFAPSPHRFQFVLGLAWMLGRFISVILMFLGVVYILLALIMPTGDRPSDVELLIRFVEVTNTAGGVMLTGWVGIRRRVEVRCARCGYEIGSVRRAPEVCPECRNRWKRVGGLRGIRRISVWWLVGGVGLILAGSVVRLLA